MVDRDARNKLAEALRHLVSGRITNDDFEEAVALRTDDTAFHAIKEEVWQLYSDLREHRLVGSDAVSKYDRRIVAQFILFLHSDLEYEWPQPPSDGFLKPFARALRRLLSFAPNPRRVDDEWKAAGDFDVWPFIRRKDYEEALSNPKLLRGRAA